MKYFTPDLIERYGSDDDAAAGPAHQEWEAVLERYECYLQSVEGELPEHVREFNRLLLHDAIVWSILRQGDRLVMAVRKDIPPRDVVILTYTLTDEPVIRQDVLSPEYRGKVMDYLYDEFELIREGDRTIYFQSILFGNGWEMSLRFRDVQVSLAEPVYPRPGTVLVAVSDSIHAKSA
jgi:hypothetical protein